MKEIGKMTTEIVGVEGVHHVTGTGKGGKYFDYLLLVFKGIPP